MILEYKVCFFPYKHNLFVPVQHFWNKGYNHNISWQLKIQLQASFTTFLQETNFKYKIFKKPSEVSVLLYHLQATLSTLETTISETA